MTIYELLDKNGISYTKINVKKGMNMFKIGNTNVLFKVNNNNQFSLQRDVFRILESNCDFYALLLLNSVGKTYYFLDFKNKNNWLKGCFESCDKKEIRLGKIVLNEKSTLNKAISILKTRMEK